MPRASFGDVLRFIHQACGIQDACDRTDRELMERFLVQREESAFSVLMRRHGPMVFGVCRRVLGSVQEAEDAFQATFLVLVRRKSSLRGKESVGGWLHGVAQRIALKARARSAQRRRREKEAANVAVTHPVDDLTWQEIRTALDEEIASLPEKYSTPIVLCYLEGKTYEQAARQLGCPKPSLASRLARAREVLRRRLQRRGITLAVAALTTSLADMAAGAPLPAILTIKTIKAAALVAAGKSVAGFLSAGAVALAEEAVAGIVAIKGKMILMVLAFGLAVGGAGWAGYGSLVEKSGPAAQAPVAKEVAGVPAKKEPNVATDQYGDPLPEGVVARLGADRFRALFAPALAFTPDGKTLVGKTMYEVLIWDAATGKERHRLPGSGYPSTTMDISPDGTMLAIDETTPGDKEAKVTLWELLRGKKVRTLSLPRGDDRDLFFRDLRFTPDGKDLIASYLGKLFVFDLASGRVRLTLERPHSQAFDRLAVASDSKILAAAVGPSEPDAEQPKYSMHILDITSGKLLRAIDDLPKDSWRQVPAFAPDGKMLAVGVSNRIYLLDPETGKELGRLESKIDDVRDLAFTPDGKKLVCGGDGTAVVWDVVNGTILHTFQGHVKMGGYIALSPDGKTVALGTGGATVCFWDLDTSKERFTEYHSHASRIGTLAFSPDGKTLVSAGSYGLEHVLLWNTAGWQRRGTLPLGARTLSFSSDGKHLAAIEGDRIKIWDFAAAKEMSPITSPDASSVTSAIFSSDGRKLFTLDNNADKKRDPDRWKCCLRHWDVESGRQDQLWVIPRQILPTSVASDGRTVSAMVRLGGISIFDVETGRERLRRGQSQRWEHLALSPDARVLASWDSNTPGQWSDSDIRLWEIATGKEIFHLKGREKRTISAAAWSADGRLVASGENAFRGVHTVRLWDAAAGKELTKFAGLKEEITALTFSPDGAFLACGLANGIILILDVAKADSKVTAKLGSEVLASCWADLAADDAAQAHRAIGTLVSASKQSLPFLQERLKSVAALDTERIHQWIAELDSDKFAVRQAAAKRLEAVGGQLQPHIQKALKAGISLETRRRLEHVLNTVTDVPGPEILRTIRALMALERIGSPEAQAVLEKLARGAPGARETEEAKASLERLKQRASRVP